MKIPLNQNHQQQQQMMTNLQMNSHRISMGFHRKIRKRRTSVSKKSRKVSANSKLKINHIANVSVNNENVVEPGPIPAPSDQSAMEKHNEVDDTEDHSNHNQNETLPEKKVEKTTETIEKQVER